MDYKEVWEVIRWIVASIIGLAVLYLGIKSFKKDSHGAIYKKIDDTNKRIDESNSNIYKKIDELQKENKDHVNREIDKILKQNSEMIANHINENVAQFDIILTHMRSIDGNVQNLNQNLIAVLQQNIKKK